MLKRIIQATIIISILLLNNVALRADELRELPEYYGVFVLSGGNLIELKRHPQSNVGQVALSIGGDMTVNSVSNMVLSDNSLTLIIFSPKAKLYASQEIMLHLVRSVVAERKGKSRLKKLREPSWHIEIKKGWKLRIAPVPGQVEMVQATISELRPGHKAVSIGDGFYDFLVPGVPTPKESCLIKVIKEGLTLRIGGNISYETCPPQWAPLPKGTLIARRLFRAGEKRFRKSDYEGALEFLREAENQPNAEMEMGKILYLKAVTEGVLGRTVDALASILQSQQKTLDEASRASAKIIEAGMFITLENYDEAFSALEAAEQLSKRRYKRFMPTIFLMRYIARLGSGDNNALTKFCKEACQYKMRDFKNLTAYIMGKKADWTKLSYEEKSYAAYHHCYRGEDDLAGDLFDSIIAEGNSRLAYHDALRARKLMRDKSDCSSARAG